MWPHHHGPSHHVMGKIHCPPFVNFTQHKQTLVTWSNSATNQRLPDSSNKACVSRNLSRMDEMNKFSFGSARSPAAASPPLAAAVPSPPSLNVATVGKDDNGRGGDPAPICALDRGGETGCCRAWSCCASPAGMCDEAESVTGPSL